MDRGQQTKRKKQRDKVREEKTEMGDRGEQIEGKCKRRKICCVETIHICRTIRMKARSAEPELAYSFSLSERNI
jgi:hypothetical protein